MLSSKSIPGHWQLSESYMLESDSHIGDAVIFDIDGVLSDAAGRQHFIDGAVKKDWEKFFSSCGDDPLIEEVAKLLSLLNDNLIVILLTGRPISVRNETLAWLQNYRLRWDILIMRNFGDHTAAKEFKSITVHEIRKLGIVPTLSFEDDIRNVEMFRQEGIPCVYIHSGYYDK